jgi:chromosome segregation ATPase
MDEAKS